MTSIHNQFGGVPFYNRFLVVTGTTTASPFLATKAELFRIKAYPGNSGVFYIGNKDGQTFPLSAGDDTGWNAVHDLDQFYHINASGSMDYLGVWYQL